MRPQTMPQTYGGPPLLWFDNKSKAARGACRLALLKESEPPDDVGVGASDPHNTKCHPQVRM